MPEIGSEVLLPRELAGVSEEVRAVPAPPVPALPTPYSLRLVDPSGEDPERIATWMALPHLAVTWEQAWSAERWRADSAARLMSTYSRPLILSYDMAAEGRPEGGVRPIGYVELYRVAKDECARIYPADPWDIGMHLALGIPHLARRGIISRSLQLMAEALFAAEPRCRRLIGDPDHHNVAIRRLLAKSGWHALGDHDIRPDRRITLHCLPRTPQDLPSDNRPLPTEVTR